MQSNNSSVVILSRITVHVMPCDTSSACRTSSSFYHQDNCFVTNSEKGATISSHLHERIDVLQVIGHSQHHSKKYRKTMSSKPEETNMTASTMTGLKGDEKEVQKPKPEPSDDQEETEPSFDIPQRFTKSGRKRAVPFTIKVRIILSIAITTLFRFFYVLN